MSGATSQTDNSIPPRDRDLIFPDEHLEENTLDELWRWFVKNKDTVDPQLVFVKLINSARRPYIPNRQSPKDCSQCKSSTQKIQQLQASLEETKRELECLQSQKAIPLPLSGNMGQQFQHGDGRQHDYDTPATDANQQKDGTIGSVSNFAPISTAFDSTAIKSGPKLCIALKSAHSDYYLSMDGGRGGLTKSNYQQYITSGAGSCYGRKIISRTEVFELLYQGEAPEKSDSGSTVDSYFSFRSNVYENIYLRANERDNQNGPYAYAGYYSDVPGGVLNCQYGQCSKANREKFKIHARGYQGRVVIESVGYPGRFLHMSPDRTVHLQGIATEAEEWIMIVVPSWDPERDHAGRVELADSRIGVSKPKSSGT